jgi:thiamine-monophosphate kinase
VNEDEIIAAIDAVLAPFDRARPQRERVERRGDDAALWQPSRSHRSAISSDMLVEGVDFTRETISLEDTGWRAMASNLSDLAAMGARPVLATIALGFPEATPLEEVVELYRGLADCAGRFKLAVAGGDLSRADALTIAITVVGEVRAADAKTRSGGRPGDVLAVTGPLGAASAGLELTRKSESIGAELAQEALRAFRRPQPRIAEGRFLGASRNVRAMMDLSDGLSTDVHRLATASRCGATIESVPVAQAARALAQAREEDPQRFALAGGEDFELLAAIRPRAFENLATRYAARFGAKLYRVGVLREGSEVLWNGVPLPRSGWDHFS